MPTSCSLCTNWSAQASSHEGRRPDGYSSAVIARSAPSRKPLLRNPRAGTNSSNDPFGLQQRDHISQDSQHAGERTEPSEVQRGGVAQLLAAVVLVPMSGVITSRQASKTSWRPV